MLLIATVPHPITGGRKGTLPITGGWMGPMRLVIEIRSVSGEPQRANALN
jgi:hypothetical protein